MSDHDSRNAAERLARVIIDDIKLYNSRYLRVPDVAAVYADAIDEGRAFFRARVDSDLHDVYESLLHELEHAPRNVIGLPARGIRPA